MRSVTALLLLLCAGQAAAQQPTLFRNARVFDGEKVLSATDVLVRDGRIAQVARSITAPSDAAVVDATGKTLLPGFIDAHSHVWGDALREAVVFGVTTELDMFSDAAQARRLREEQQTGEANDRADLFSAGILATAPGGHGTEYGMQIPTITTPDSAQAFIDARLAEGSDYIKIVYDDGKLYGRPFPTIDEPTLRALIAATHRRNKLAVVHIGTAAEARAALNAGADGLVHLFTDTAASSDIARLAKSKNAFVIPTLVVLHSITGKSAGSELVDDPHLGPYFSQIATAMIGQSFPIAPTAPAKSYAVPRRVVGELRAAGVPVLAGTDASNPGTAHGASMHAELELLVEAGFTPIEALTAATGLPARLFKLADRGRIAQGLRADLLLVNGDPTTNITATRAIEGVWKNGVVIDRTSFAKAAAEARASTGAAPKALQEGTVSNFENGTLTPAFGTEWMESTDGFAGGKSTGQLEIVEGGASGTAKSLRISGVISDAVPFAWSGASWSPGAIPFAPADLSAKTALHFQAKGDGGSYRVLVFAQSKGMTPLEKRFNTTADWTEIVLRWSDFGIDGRDVMAVIFAAGPQAGAFTFQIDEVRFQ